MKIGITTDVIDQSPTHRGIPLALKRLLRELVEIDHGHDISLVHYGPDGDEVYSLGFDEIYLSSVNSPSPVFSKLIGNWLRRPDRLNELGILHVTNPFLYEAPLIAKFAEKTVLTVWDMAYYLSETRARVDERPKAWAYQQLWKLVYPRLTDDIDRFIAISEGTRSEMEQYMGVSPSVVNVVHLGIDDEFSVQDVDRDRDSIVPSEPYILTDKPYPAVLDIYRNLRDRGVTHDLVVFSGRGYVDEDDVAERNLEDHVTFLGYVSKNDLIALYNAADLYIRLVYFTGFGIPTVEAMACGCPVVVSNADAGPEVVGDAGVLLDPDDIDAWTDAIESVLGDESRRQSMIEKGLRRAEQFSYHRMAQETLSVYDEVREE